MPVTVCCACCEASTTLPTVREAYVRDPMPSKHPTPYVGDSDWTVYDNDHLFCPAHREAPGIQAEALDQYELAAEAALRQWRVENPEPVPDWRDWRRGPDVVTEVQPPESASPSDIHERLPDWIAYALACAWVDRHGSDWARIEAWGWRTTPEQRVRVAAAFERGMRFKSEILRMEGVFWSYPRRLPKSGP